VRGLGRFRSRRRGPKKRAHAESQPLEITTSNYFGAPLISFAGRITPSDVVRVRAAIEKVMGLRTNIVLLGLSQVDSLPQSIEALLLDLARELEPPGFLGIIGLKQGLLDTLLVCGLADEPGFRIFPRAEEAFRAVREERQAWRS
jgi:hypothetical protein